MPARNRIARGLLVATSVAASAAFALPSYVAVPLGTLGGPASYPASINESGQVAGFSYLPLIDPALPPGTPGNSVWHAVVHANGVMKDLGLSASGLSSATGINASGQVSAFALPGGGVERALRVSNGTAVDVGLPGADGGRATGINDAGQVTGYSGWSASGQVHAFVYDAGVSRDIHSLGLTTQGNAINASGEVTGIASFAPNGMVIQFQHAFLYSNGAMKVLGDYGIGSSFGTAINDSGQVAGSEWLPGWQGSHAFLYADGTMKDLGTLGGDDSFAFGLNNAGVVVGTSTIADDTSRAFLYDGTAMLDLNALVVSGLDGAVLTQALDINDKGQVVATACLDIGMCQAFRLDLLPATGAKVLAIEYRHAAFDHYFLTADPAEIAALDGGAIAGWARTGESFELLSEPVAGASPLCRFFSAAFGTKSSHFFTPATSECMWVNGNRDWQFEGVRLYVKRPLADGTCPAGTRPVYRVYNDGQGGAPAHRNTTSLAVRAAMLSQGWVPEGVGADGVGMCAPL